MDLDLRKFVVLGSWPKLEHGSNDAARKGLRTRKRSAGVTVQQRLIGWRSAVLARQGVLGDISRDMMSVVGRPSWSSRAL